MRATVALLVSSILSLAACGNWTISAPGGCADLTIHGSALYWTGGLGNTLQILSAPVSGGSPTLLVGDGGDLLYVSDSSLYFLAAGGNDAGLTLSSAPLSGGTTSVVLTGLGTFQNEVVTDGTTVYWFDGQGNIEEAPLAGGTPQTFVSSSDLHGVVPMVIGGSFLFLASGEVVPLDGGAPTYLRSDNMPASDLNLSFVADGQGLYWAESWVGVQDSSTCDGEVGAALLDGSSSKLATDQCFPLSVAADDTNVYWSNLGAAYWPNGPGGGRFGAGIFAIPKTGGSLRHLSPDSPPLLLPNGDYLYFCSPSGPRSENSFIGRVPK